MTCVAADGIKARPESFHHELLWWVRRAEVASEINEQRTNASYWPASFDSCIRASTDVKEVAKDCDVCLLALPSEFLASVAEDLRQSLKPTATVVSLIKSLKIEDGKVKPYTRQVAQLFPQATVAALMGPNLYKDMAKGEFAEATIGVAQGSKVEQLQQLFNTQNFAVQCISDVEAVDLCGCLKNTFTLACGFAEGCEWGGNVRAAIIRRGLLEMNQFLEEFLPAERAGALPVRDVTLEACGIGDLILSCTVGRGRQLARDFVKAGGESWQSLEERTMGGMRIPDWGNVQQAHQLLTAHGRLEAYPLLAQTYRIAFAGAPAQSILEALRGEATAIPSAPRMRDPDLNGMAALVTGAGNGIGCAIAERLAKLGAKVWAVDRDQAALKLLEERQARCTGVVADLGSIESLSEVTSKVGELDFLVNAGGILVLQEFGEQTPAVWDATLDINARAIWFLMHELGQKMAAKRRGSIVNISSQSSSVAVSTKHMAYSTSKAAVDHMTRLAAYALAKDNVRVNAVNPTVVRTALAIKGHGEEGLKRMAEKVPLQRICEPEDVADAVVFLLSESSRMITGITLPVDGGFVAARP